MKNLKKILALLMALMILAASMSAFAATLTIKQDGANIADGHKYDAYAIFTGKLSPDNTLSNVQWGAGVDKDTLVAALSDADANAKIKALGIKSTATAAEVAEALSGVTDAETIEAFKDIVAANLGTAAKTNQASPISDLADGYYFVKDVTTLSTTEPDALSAYILQVIGNVTINVKTDAPDVDKKIDEGANAGKLEADDLTANNKSVGDDVPYIIASKVPNMANYEKYYMEFADTLTGGLTYKGDLKVEIGGKEVTDSFPVTTDPATPVEGTDTKINVKIDDLKSIQGIKAGDDIVITYTATVNEKAKIGVVGNPNTVKLIYSNNPEEYEEGEGDNKKPVTGETPEHKVITYVTEIDIVKVDGKNNTKKLEGATFTLSGDTANKVLVTEEVFTEDAQGTYWKLNDGTYTTTDPNGEGIDKTQYASTETKYKKETKTTTKTATDTVAVAGTTDETGSAKFAGLSAGTYTIKETQAPVGYNKIDEDISIEIEWTAPTDTTVTDTSACTWSVKSATQGDTDIKAKVSVGNDGHITLTIENNSGATLPATGGIGTTIFYVAGSILVLAALVLLVTKRRMGADD